MVCVLVFFLCVTGNKMVKYGNTAHTYVHTHARALMHYIDLLVSRGDKRYKPERKSLINCAALGRLAY